MNAVPPRAWCVTRGATRATLLALLLAAAVSPAAAQWAWKDDNGRIVYSDRPPPTSVKPDQIVRQGTFAGSAPTQPAAAGQPAAGAAGAAGTNEPRAEGKDSKSGPRTYAEREMDFRKRQQEQAAADRKAAEEAANASRKTGDCERSRGYLRALEEGQRVTRTDAQGNREFLDDSQRASEISRMRDQVSRACN